jgi:hypothetical protein
LRQLLPAIQHSKNHAYSINRKQVDLFLRVDYLPKAYPEALRTEIGKKVRLLSEAVSESEWKNHNTSLANELGTRDLEP